MNQHDNATHSINIDDTAIRDGEQAADVPDGRDVRTGLSSARLEELQRQALLPINQAATLKLRQAGVAPESGVQPVFQLMKLGLAYDKRKRYHDIAHELGELQTADDQAGALAYLLANVPGGLREAVRTILRRNPGSAARTLLDLLDMRIKSDPKKYDSSNDVFSP